MKEAIPVPSVPLLPGRLRLPGYILVLLGAVLLALRFHWGIKPEWLNIKMFALYSSYLETKKMLVITNQVLEEIGALLLLAGLILVAFSREQKEGEWTNTLRLKSFLIATYATAGIYVCALALLFGLSFMIYMLTVPFVFLVVYIISFRILQYRYPKQEL